MAADHKTGLVVVPSRRYATAAAAADAGAATKCVLMWLLPLHAVGTRLVCTHQHSVVCDRFSELITEKSPRFVIFFPVK